VSADLDALIDAMAPVLGLDLAPEERAAVRDQLAVTVRMAELVLGLELPEDTEPAAVFTP
jgi:hypothetical protein